jgi:PAS domain S-box-containing protein
MDPVVGDRGAFLLFIVAVACTAWYAGLGPAILASVLGGMSVDFFFIPPRHRFAIGSWGDLLLEVLFLGASLQIAVIVHRLSRVRDRLAREADERGRINADLERRVADRTEELHKSAELLLEAERVSRIGSWEWDVAGDRLTWSDELFRIYDISPADFRPTCEGFLERLAPAERDRVRAVLRRSCVTGEPFDFKHRIERRDGSPRTLRARGRVERSPSRVPLRLYGTVQDVTDEEEFEERSRTLALRESRERERARTAELAAVMESVPAAIWITRDPEGRNIVGNAFSYQLLGMSPGENISKTAPGATVPFDIYAEGRKTDPADLPIQRAAATGRPVLGHEHEIRRVDGVSRWVFGNAVPIFGESGRVERVVAAFVDVTERKHAEERIRVLNAELEGRVLERTRSLEEVVRELEAFSYTVAHDLRAPLRAMKGFAELVLEDAGDRLGPEERDYLTRITAAADRMDALVQGLLAYSRLSRDTFVPEAIDLAGILRDVQDQFDMELRDAGAELVVEPGSLQVLGHSASLRQVIANLVSNAAKFVAPGHPPRIRIVSEERGDRVRVWVEDNGIGVAPADRTRIFKVFEKLHDPETYPGTGIGLAIVKRAVEKMGGEVGVESRPPQGSRFWVELPRLARRSSPPEPGPAAVVERE